MANKIEVNNLRISFWTNNGAVRAVRDVSFKVEEGKTLAIVGESGSGKSVTAKAMLGILAGNAIVEGGEIFYNGIDLMKVEEEFFHQIRGNNIAMIFQDPLSSLNPIMKIGRQLVEAMIANNKASRKQGKADYIEKYKGLQKYMIASGQDSSSSKAYLKRLDEYITEGNALESKYNNAHDIAETLITNIDGVKIDMINGNPKEVGVTLRRILKTIPQCLNPFMIPEDDNRIKRLTEKYSQLMQEYISSKDDNSKKPPMESALDELKLILQEGNNREKANFFALGYMSKTKGRDSIIGKKITELNKNAKSAMDNEFISEFRPMIESAIKYSDNEIIQNKIKTSKQIEEELSKLSGTIDVKQAKSSAELLKPMVKSCINPLDINKDSVCRTFSNAIDSTIKIYSSTLKSENLSQKRKAKMRKKDRLPDELDLEILQNNIRLVLQRARDSFEKVINDKTAIDYKLKVENLVLHMDKVSSQMDYKLSGSLAKSRAITLMEEVGIPMARHRFKQYPFEFSGGMRQRIVIAIALASNPDVLICDEPTTALDVTIQAQILDLINELKRERKLSIIFITHDLGVVANMADDIAVMYAGKLVEKGTSDEIFYESAHPYTWALLSSMPDLDTKEKLEYIPGVPPNMIYPPKGDAFAARNKYAMQIDFEQQPPMFDITPTHKAATWLLHPDAPKVEPPAIVTDRIKRMKEKWGGSNE